MPLPAGNKLYLSPRGIGSNHEAIKLSACLGNCLRTENFFKLVVLEVKRWAIQAIELLDELLSGIIEYQKR